MMEINLLKILLVLTILGICAAAYDVNAIKRCSMSDIPCNAIFYKGIVEELKENGIPEMGIPPGDPYEMKNLNLLVLGLLNLTLYDGTATGFKTCDMNKYSIKMDTKRAHIGFACEKFSIEGRYNIERTPALAAILGQLDIHGNGNTKIMAEKIQLDIEYEFHLKRLKDNEIHFLIDSESLTHSYKIMGKMTVAGDNLVIGGEEVSAIISKILSQNQAFTINTFGNTIIEKIVDIYNTELEKFFAYVPGNKITIDDLESHVKN